MSIAADEFQIAGRSYGIDEHGVLCQVDPQSFQYSEEYVSRYDNPEYRENEKKLSAIRLEFCKASLGRDIVSLYDLGYGNGAFLRHARGEVSLLYGYDAAELEVPGVTQSVDTTMNVDVLTMWDVLEHISDLSFLDGIGAEMIAVTVPYCHWRTEGIGWVESEYIHLKPDEHVRHFDPDSLAETMRSHGWRNIALCNSEDVVRTSRHLLANTFTSAYVRG